MREISGKIIIPSNYPSASGAMVLIEIRDISRADTFSTVISQTRLTDINFEPGEKIPFSMSVPEVTEKQSLSIRVHISPIGEIQQQAGDLLTTRSYAIPSKDVLEDISVFVEQI